MIPLVSAVLISVGPASAQTLLRSIHISPDITVQASSGVITPQEVQCYGIPTGVVLTTFAGIPPGVNVTNYLPITGTEVLVTMDTTAALPTDDSGDTVTVAPRDVVVFSSLTNFFLPAVFFQGSNHGVPDGARIDALGMDLASQLLLSFDVTVSLPKAGGGTLTVKPADVVSFDGSAYTLVFDSAAAGVPDGMNLDGASMLPNTDLLVVFDEFGSMGGTDFTPRDVLEFNSGANSWVLAFDAAARDDWPDGSLIQGVVGDPDLSATSTATPTSSASATPTATATASPTTTGTPSKSATATPTASATLTATATASATLTATATPTATTSATPTGTGTATRTSTATPTQTASATATSTAGETPTATPTATGATATPTPTATATPTATPTPVAVTLKIKPKSLKFPKTAMGTTSNPKTVRVSNPKGKTKHPGLPVVIEMLSDAGPGVFMQTNDCFASLAPGTFCTISVTFTPSAAIKQTGTLTITDNANHSPQHVSLSGTGK